MDYIQKITHYFTKQELILWASSVLFITLSFLLFDRTNYLILVASLVGVTSLIFNAKGNPFGQFLMVVFGLLYGLISYQLAYYGEMMTYMGMTAPMALFSLISWLRHPYEGKKAEVEINRLKRKEILFMFFLTALVSFVFYFILSYFNTAYLYLSTLSVATSFLAVYMTFRRSAFFAIAYAANDVILIVLWILAALTDRAYFSVVICFVMFLVNDLYGFINWRKMYKRQLKASQREKA